MLVRARMTADVITVTPGTTLDEALQLTRSHHIRHLPVVGSEGLVGVVTDRDLRLALPPVWAAAQEDLRKALEARTVGEVMTRDVVTASPDMAVEDAGKLMAANRVGCLPVLDGDGLVGIITETDLLRALVQVFGADRPSSRIEVRMRNRPGELARVVRVVGVDQGVNITGLVVPPAEGAPESVAIMRLQTLDPRPIVARLRRLGYRVGWPAIELDEDAGSEATPARDPMAAEL